MEGIGAGLGVLLFVLGIVLVIAWIILPFAVIGTKSLLQELIDETRKTNALLQQFEAGGSLFARLRDDESKVA
jgi:predicted PurR-regulated permease PerM